MIVSTVIQKWYTDVMPVMSWAQSGLEGDAVGKYTSLFSADDGAVGSQDLDWFRMRISISIALIIAALLILSLAKRKLK